MSKTLASRLDGLEESATMALNAKAKQLQEAGKTIYNLTAGELSSTRRIISALLYPRVLDRNKYTPVAGLPELRRAIADKRGTIRLGLDQDR